MSNHGDDDWPLTLRSASLLDEQKIRDILIAENLDAEGDYEEIFEKLKNFLKTNKERRRTIFELKDDTNSTLVPSVESSNEATLRNNNTVINNSEQNPTITASSLTSTSNISAPIQNNFNDPIQMQSNINPPLSSQLNLNDPILNEGNFTPITSHPSLYQAANLYPNNLYNVPNDQNNLNSQFSEQNPVQTNNGTRRRTNMQMHSTPNYGVTFHNIPPTLGLTNPPLTVFAGQRTPLNITDSFNQPSPLGAHYVSPQLASQAHQNTNQVPPPYGPQLSQNQLPQPLIDVITAVVQIVLANQVPPIPTTQVPPTSNNLSARAANISTQNQNPNNTNQNFLNIPTYGDYARRSERYTEFVPDPGNFDSLRRQNQIANLLKNWDFSFSGKSNEDPEVFLGRLQEFAQVYSLTNDDLFKSLPSYSPRRSS